MAAAIRDQDGSMAGGDKLDEQKESRCEAPWERRWKQRPKRVGYSSTTNLECRGEASQLGEKWWVSEMQQKTRSR